MKKNITKKMLQEMLENSLRQAIKEEKDFERYVKEEIYDYHTEGEHAQEES
jgi:hypothetical protein